MKFRVTLPPGLVKGSDNGFRDVEAARALVADGVLLFGRLNDEEYGRIQSRDVVIAFAPWAWQTFEVLTP